MNSARCCIADSISGIPYESTCAQTWSGIHNEWAEKEVWLVMLSRMVAQENDLVSCIYMLNKSLCIISLYIYLSACLSVCLSPIVGITSNHYKYSHNTFCRELVSGKSSPLVRLFWWLHSWGESLVVCTDGSLQSAPFLLHQGKDK